MTWWPPLRMRIFIASKACTSSEKVAPALSQSGRPAQKSSSITHWRKFSWVTGAASSMPKVRTRSSSFGPVAGTMQSTIELGKVAFASIQSARSGSDRRASETIVWRRIAPLPCRLSQLWPVNGPVPAARRRFKAAIIAPKAVRGASGLAASCRMSGWSASKRLVAGSM